MSLQELQALADDTLIAGLAAGLRELIDRLLADGVAPTRILNVVAGYTVRTTRRPASASLTYLALEAYLARLSREGC